MNRRSPCPEGFFRGSLWVSDGTDEPARRSDRARCYHVTRFARGVWADVEWRQDGLLVVVGPPVLSTLGDEGNAEGRVGEAPVWGLTSSWARPGGIRSERSSMGRNSSRSDGLFIRHRRFVDFGIWDLQIGAPTRTEGTSRLTQTQWVLFPFLGRSSSL